METSWAIRSAWTKEKVKNPKTKQFTMCHKATYIDPSPVAELAGACCRIDV